MGQWLRCTLTAEFCAVLSLCAVYETLVGGVSLRVLAALMLLACPFAGLAAKNAAGRLRLVLLVLSAAVIPVLTGILMGLFRDTGFMKILVLSAAGYFAFLLFRTGESGFFPIWMEPCALLLSVSAVVRCFFRMETGFGCNLIGPGGLFAGLLWLADRNRQNQQVGAHNAESQETLPVPKALMRANRNMVAVFLLCAILLGLCSAGLFPYLIRGAAFLVSGILDGIVFLGRGVEKLVAEKPGTSGANPIRVTPSSSPTPTSEIEPEVHKKSSLLENLLNSAFSQVNVKASVLAAALLLLCAVAVVIVLRRRRRTENREDSDYTEEVEHIRRSRRIPAIRKAAFHHRKQRFSDMKTDRMKLRFLWWMLLKTPPKGWSSAQTPWETAALLGAEWERLSELYSLARYAPDTPLPPDSGAEAEVYAEKIRQLRHQTDPEKEEIPDEKLASQPAEDRTDPAASQRGGISAAV